VEIYWTTLAIIVVPIGVYVLARFVFTAYFRAKRDFLYDLVIRGKEQDDAEDEG